MEESRFFLLELKLISSLSLYDSMNSLWAETISTLSVFSSNPLFSCFIAFCTLVFLYLPHLFWKIVFSPVLILTWILLLTILRLGAIQKSQHEENENQGKYSESIVNVNEENRAIKEEKQSSRPVEPKETKSLEQVHKWINSQTGFESRPCFLEWNVKAPLEVIFEEYEGEEEEEEEEAREDPNEKGEKHNMGVIQRYPSLSRYYPESDSDSSSESGFPAIGEWDLPENNCFFRWDDEDDREGLIEIALDGCKNNKRDMEFHFEEENLIEIDISPMRYRELSGEDEVFYR